MEAARWRLRVNSILIQILFHMEAAPNVFHLMVIREKRWIVHEALMEL